MSLIKQALEKDLHRFDDEQAKSSATRMLMEKTIEKRKRQDEKLAFLFQLSLFLLLAVFLWFLLSTTAGIEEYRTMITVLVLSSTILFTQVCYKLIGFLQPGK